VVNQLSDTLGRLKVWRFVTFWGKVTLHIKDNMNNCLYLQETNNSNGQECECIHPKYSGDICEHCPIFKEDKKMKIEKLDDLIFVLQEYRNQYGNIEVNMEIDEGGKRSINLIDRLGR
jgi:hypothetical protein